MILHRSCSALSLSRRLTLSNIYSKQLEKHHPSILRLTFLLAQCRRLQHHVEGRFEGSNKRRSGSRSLHRHRSGSRRFVKMSSASASNEQTRRRRHRSRRRPKLRLNPRGGAPAMLHKSEPKESCKYKGTRRTCSTENGAFRQFERRRH